MDKKNDLKTKINYLFSLKNKVIKKDLTEFTPRTINFHNNDELPKLDKKAYGDKLSPEEEKEEKEQEIIIKNAVFFIKRKYNVIEDKQKKEESKIVNQMKETKVPCNDLIRVIKFSEREIIPCTDLFDDIMDLK